MPKSIKGQRALNKNRKRKKNKKDGPDEDKTSDKRVKERTIVNKSSSKTKPSQNEDDDLFELNEEEEDEINLQKKRDSASSPKKEKEEKIKIIDKAKNVSMMDIGSEQYLLIYKMKSRRRFSFKNSEALLALYSKIRLMVHFENFSRSIEDLPDYTPGNAVYDADAKLYMDLPREDAERSIPEHRAPKIGRDVLCVGMDAFIQTLTNRVFKYICLDFINRYIQIERHIVIEAPDGFGKIHCTKVFCDAHMIDFIQINPYQIKTELIQNAVRFACATKTPTIIFFNDADKWLTQAGAVDNYLKSSNKVSGMHQSQLPAAPFVGDFLQTMHNASFMKNDDPIWFVYGTTVDPKFFYVDFHLLHGITYVKGPQSITNKEASHIAKHTFKERLKVFEIHDINMDDVHLQGWIQHTFRNSVISPRGVVHACDNIIMKKSERVDIDQVAKIVSLYEEIKDTDDEAQNHKNKKRQRAISEFTTKVGASLLITDQDLPVQKFQLTNNNNNNNNNNRLQKTTINPTKPLLTNKPRGGNMFLRNLKSQQNLSQANKKRVHFSQPENLQSNNNDFYNSDNTPITCPTSPSYYNNSDRNTNKFSVDNGEYEDHFNYSNEENFPIETYDDF